MKNFIDINLFYEDKKEACIHIFIFDTDSPFFLSDSRLLFLHSQLKVVHPQL